MNRISEKPLKTRASGTVDVYGSSCDFSGLLLIAFIAGEQGLQIPQREPFQIDIAFAVDEFDFFS